MIVKRLEGKCWLKGEINLVSELNDIFFLVGIVSWLL